MTLDTLYLVSQIVGVVVIVATLIAILWQGWQTNKIARADLTLSVWMQTGAMQYSLFDNPEKAAFMHRAMYGSAPLNDEEKDRAYTVFGLAIGTYEAAFNLRKRGFIEAAAYERQMVTTRLYFKSPRVRRWWRRVRDAVADKDFRDILDAVARDWDAKGETAPSAGDGQA